MTTMNDYNKILERGYKQGYRQAIKDAICCMCSEEHYKKSKNGCECIFHKIKEE